MKFKNLKVTCLIESVFLIVDPTFFNGRCAVVLAGGKRVGVFGVLHPEVLRNFDLPFPTSALELNLEVILPLLSSK